MADLNQDRRDPFDIPLTSFRSRFFRNVGIGLMMGVLAAMISEILTVQNIETLIYDWRLSERKRSPTEDSPITLVLIDEKSLGTGRPTHGIPLPFLANLIDAISSRRPKVIGLDLVLSGITEDDPGALELRNDIRLAKNVILSGRAYPDPSLGQKTMTAPEYLQDVALSSAIQHLNIGDFGRVRDGFVRLALTGDQRTNSLAVQLAQAAEGVGSPEHFFEGLEASLWTTPFTFRVPTDPNAVNLRINFHGPRSEVGFRDGTYPCFDAEINTIQTVSSRFFEDKVVIIGSALNNEANRFLTPMGRVEMWTAEIVANLTETILDRDFLRETTAVGRTVWFMVVGLIAAFLCTIRKLLPVMLLILLYTLALVYLLDNNLVNRGFILPFLPTLLVPWLTALGSVGARIALDDREIRLLRDVFGRSVSPAIAQELVAKIAYEREKNSGDGPHLLSEECVSTILFLDVANFTPLSETFSPEKLFIFTNELLDRIADCVFENKGSLIRYTGDGLIALFGRPIKREDHAYLACETALRMQEELDQLNRVRQKREEPLVDIRIGINTGSMMVGLLGGHQRYDYSVLGNEVNIAARLERLNKDFGTTTLVGEETVRMIKDDFICRPLGSISLKGKSDQVAVYELVCRTGQAISESLVEFLRFYERGFMAIRNNQVDEAIEAFNQALNCKPDDLATQKLLSRAEERTRTGTGLP